MEYKTETGGMEVIYSCSLMPYTSKDKKIKIKLHERVNVELIFIDNEGSTQDNLINIKSVKETSTITLEALNFKNSLGTCTSEAIHIGMINSKKIYLNFAAYDIGGMKIAHLTFYREI